MTRAFMLSAMVALTGCAVITGVDAVPVPCTLARAGADTTTARVVNAAGDTVAVVTVGRCRP